VLTDTIPDSFASGRFNRVPVINGNNADEGSIMVMFSHEYRFKPLQATDYEKRIRYLVGDDQQVIDQLTARYPLENYEDAGAALAELFGDSFMACNVQEASQVLSKSTPVYGYTFTYPDAAFILPEPRQLGAFHAAELQFVFHAPMNWFKRRFSGEELALANAMMDYWSQFAHTGNPNKDGLQPWPLFFDGNKQMVFDRQLSLSSTFKQEACAFWRHLGIEGRQVLSHFEK
jgi:para-nitrobenzyl esterase